MDLRTRVLVETRSTLSVVSLAPLSLKSFERPALSLTPHIPSLVSNSAVTVTSVILSLVAALPQLIGPSVHSCVQHCPERVTVVAAVFVPLSPVSPGSVLALYCLIL